MKSQKPMKEVQSRYGARAGRASADPSSEPLDVTRLMYTLSIEDRVAALKEDLDRIAASRRECHDNDSRTQEPPRGMTEDKHDHVPMNAQSYSAKETAENKRADMVGQEDRRTPFDAGRTSHQTCPPHQPPNLFLHGHAVPFAPAPYATLPGLQHAQGRSTAVRGHQTDYTDSVINVDSGNTTTHTITNSNNDSSLATYSRRGRRN